MGAASCILYASCDPTLSVLILDSPFASLKLVLDEYLSRYSILPKRVLNYFFERIREHIRNKARFDILEVNPIKFACLCDMPAILMHGIDDKLVSISHSRMLYENYKGDKYLLELGGGHNSSRAPKVIERIIEILKNVFNSPHLSKEMLEESIKTKRDHHVNRLEK